jgi:hypothetical protein
MPTRKAQAAPLRGKRQSNPEEFGQTRHRKTTSPKAKPAKIAQRQRLEKLHDMIALAIRQPYAEEILRGWKRYEFRSIPTNITRRVLIYASLKPGDPSDSRS